MTSDAIPPQRARRSWLWRMRRDLRGLGRDWHQRSGDAFTLSYAVSVSHRLPLLYLVVILDIALLAGHFAPVAPFPLVVAGPLLTIFAAWRAFHWRPGRVLQRPLPQLRRELDAMGKLGGLSALVFIAWCLGLYSYGDDLQRSLVHFVVGVTLLSGILGMAHSPQTSLRLALAYIVPTSVAYLAMGHSNSLSVVLVQLVVTGILLLVCHGHHRDFIRLELSRQQLTRRERQAARLATSHYQQATADSLTGGLNRRGILARLESEMTRETRHLPWLALVDLDGFKHINDTYGHAAGDAVLRAVSERIGATRGVVAHGRLGGDEFAILFDPAFDGKAVTAAARRLSAAIREPIVHSTATLRLCASIGVHRVAPGNVSSCLERADAALYKAKDLGEGAVVRFGPDDEIKLQQRISATRQFNDCALEDRLRLLYQPIWDFRENRVTGFEAFARWSPDGETWHTPGTFLTMAEATGRTGELTRLVIARALAEARPDLSGLGIAINLAPRDVTREGAVESIAALVAQAGVAPQAVTLEVTERALLRDPRRAALQLEQFRDAGFRIALDDFGAGWSSLSQLRDLPLDMLKIDRQLVAALPEDPGARAVAGMLVVLAWQLGLGCIAEGIETEAQVAAARALGLHMMQGYHFGRPEPAAVALAGIDRAVA